MQSVRWFAGSAEPYTVPGLPPGSRAALDRLTLGGQLLRVAADFDDLLSAGQTGDEAVAWLNARGTEYRARSCSPRCAGWLRERRPPRPPERYLRADLSRAATFSRKYAIVVVNPSSSVTFGSQPSSVRAPRDVGLAHLRIVHGQRLCKPARLEAPVILTIVRGDLADRHLVRVADVRPDRSRSRASGG